MPKSIKFTIWKTQRRLRILKNRLKYEYIYYKVKLSRRLKQTKHKTIHPQIQTKQVPEKHTNQQKKTTHEQSFKKTKSKGFVEKTLKQLKNINNKEVKLVTKHLINRLNLGGEVSLEDVEKICINLNEEEKEVVFDNLQNKNIELQENSLKYNEKFVSENEKRLNEIRRIFTQQSIIKITQNNIQFNQQFNEGIVASGFPEEIEKDWSGPLTTQKENYDFCINISPSSIRSIELYINQKIREIEEKIHFATSKGKKDSKHEKEIENLKEQLTKITKNKTKLFNFSAYLNCKGLTEEETTELSRKMISLNSTKGIDCKTATHYHKEILKNTIPVGIDFIKGREMIMPSEVLKKEFPFKKVEQ